MAAAAPRGWGFSPDPDVEAAVTAVFRDIPPIAPAGLARFQAYLAALGNPHLHLPPVFHVAGTNGKGSTAAFLQAGLEAAGLTVHKFTSPHLARFEERIVISGRMIDAPTLLPLIAQCRAVAQKHEVSFFEFFTALAFLAFAQARADAVVLEVGLGGTHDCTNVVPQNIAVLTRISFDHMHILGDTLPLIAAQKAGIMKAGCLAITAPQPGAGVMQVFTQHAAQTGARLLPAGDAWSVSPLTAEGFVYHGADGDIPLPPPALAGAHQVENAGAAITALRHSPFSARMTPEVLARAMRDVRWPGRLQRLRTGPLVDILPAGWEVWLDGAHNDSGAEVLARHAATHWADRPLHLITAMKQQKDARAFCGALAPHVVDAWAVSGDFGTDADLAVPMMPPDVLRTALGDAGLPDPQAAHTAEEALRAIIAAYGNAAPRRILLAGSLYLVGFILRTHA